MNTRHIAFASNRLRDVRQRFRQMLATLYPSEEVNAMFAMLCEAFLAMDTTQMLLHLDEPINQSDLLRFHWALADLQQERPIQHIIGYTDFCGCRLRVNADVLIPRPETEEIVRTIAATTSPHSVLDLCTGSGCIAIALKRLFPQADVYALDVSPEALAVATDNARNNGADIHFVTHDLLASSPTLPLHSFDLIVSNPPYIRQSEQALMRRNVLDYDPHLALFVPDNDPLRFYRPIARYAASHLAPHGLLALEINEALALETATLLQANGFATRLHHDFRGKPRLLTAQRQ